MHGGGVAVTSEGEGKGSEFTLRLPLASQGGPVAPPHPLQSLTLANRLPRRILVVDDNRDCAESLCMLLRISGDEVRVAHDGPSALEAADAFRPDVAVLDIGMPGMNGYELAGALRQRQDLKRLVLIALTGWGHDDDRRRTQEAGFNAHLVKPVVLDELQALLEEAAR